jgi:hypothetical protein
VSVHHVDVQNSGAAAFDCLNLVTETGEIRRQDRRRDLDVSVVEHSIASALGNRVTDLAWSGLVSAEESPVACLRLN